MSIGIKNFADPVNEYVKIYHDNKQLDVLKLLILSLPLSLLQI